ncbi:DNA-binding transcriptional regulator YhcF (GntR family) [Natranaerovirga hydrolytica]|uniref:DNA-binding transcriptional regulator YhcF (GntR family) n=1 Tax=Natranaerovirga hydrolytica TaxID=680378 RepID=A0A4R1MHF7_9FIRM|nr:GntR family transcriptional regulator [Natranaerovirga hydrolytica]TCK90564.1 DNA-binding transcriptional regulator YhcF (GntR family) [Natranaerovirga hydrolytica]
MEFDNHSPIYLQVIQDIKKNMIIGTIHAGDKLPSTRELSLQYNINPNTASRVYKALELENLCFTKRGLGTFVTEQREQILKVREEMAHSLIDNFINGMTQLGYTPKELITIIKNYEKGDDELC